MYFDLFTKWYILLPLAFSIGPILSLAGVDGMVHTLLRNAGGGVAYREKNFATRITDSVLRGAPYWIVISSLLNVFWGSPFPITFLTLILLGGIMKIVYGRGYMDETSSETLMSSSRVWNSINKRGLGKVWEELTGTFTKYAYPSLHTITTLAAIYFTSCNPSLWFFLPPLLLWMVWVNHHWFSDVLSGLCLVWGTVDLLAYLHTL